jgi:hypothetical protein
MQGLTTDTAMAATGAGCQGNALPKERFSSSDAIYKHSHRIYTCKLLYCPQAGEYRLEQSFDGAIVLARLPYDILIPYIFCNFTINFNMMIQKTIRIYEQRYGNELVFIHILQSWF